MTFFPQLLNVIELKLLAQMICPLAQTRSPSSPNCILFLCLAPLAAASILIGMECFRGLNTVKRQMLYSVTLVVTTLLLAMTLTAPKECKNLLTEKKDRGSQCQRATQVCNGKMANGREGEVVSHPAVYQQHTSWKSMKTAITSSASSAASALQGIALKAIVSKSTPTIPHSIGKTFWP